MHCSGPCSSVPVTPSEKLLCSA